MVPAPAVLVDPPDARGSELEPHDATASIAADAASARAILVRFIIISFRLGFRD
jgi:hypothetical protein